MKVIAKKGLDNLKSVQELSLGTLFYFGKETFEEALVNGNIFMKIKSKNPFNIKDVFDTSTYVRLSDKFEFVQRTGPIMVNVIDSWDYTLPVIEGVVKTLEEMESGTFVSYFDDFYLIVTDVVESNKMVSLLNIKDYSILKCSLQASFNKANFDIVIN